MKTVCTTLAILVLSILAGAGLPCRAAEDVGREANSGKAKEPGRSPLAAISIMVWDDPAIGRRLSHPALGTAEALSRAGAEVQRLDTEALAAARQTVAKKGVDCLVLPYGGCYPACLASAMVKFLAAGGVLITCGPGAFDTPLYPTAHGWVSDTDVAADDAGVRVPLAPTWPLDNSAADDAMSMQASSSTEALFRTDDLRLYAYLGTKLPPLSTDDAVLDFEARGDEQTKRLCLELRERDGSRWKAVVPLTSAWRRQRIHTARFVSYANDKLGRTGSAIHGRDLQTVFVGFTAAMVGEGPHRFSLRNLSIKSARASQADLASQPVFLRPGHEVVRWFGTAAHPSALLPPLSCFASSSPWEGRGLRSCNDDRLPLLHAVKGPVSGYTVGSLVSSVEAGGKSRASLRSRLRLGDERIVLLRSRRLVGKGEDALVLFFPRTGLIAGGRWLCWGVEGLDARSGGAFRDVFPAAVSVAVSSTLGDGIRPRFRVGADGAIRLDADLWLRRVSPEAAQHTLQLTVSAGNRPLVERMVTISAAPNHGRSSRVHLLEDIPLKPRDWFDLSLVATLREGESEPPFFGPLRFRFQAREALRQVCDFLVQEAADDGKMMGYSFIDSRGVRTLLAGYELLGERRYLRTARRWGDIMMREQRPDGGYRMGYGITSKGESCYVADGGEIAVAMARLVSYARGQAKARALLRSLDAYMAYREEFRVPSGGIGVGWCLQDYGKRPVVPLDKPRRIFAPERNTYTIGCSLAAAYACARLHDSAVLERRAAADADWLIPRLTSLNGAFIESFMFAHAFTTDAKRREIYAAVMRKKFCVSMRQAAQQERSWWLDAGGRRALNLDGLIYWLSRVEDDPELRAEMMRAAATMFSPDSPQSILSMMRRGSMGHDEWIALCYGSLSLADVLSPLVSMEHFVPAGFDPE